MFRKGGLGLVTLTVIALASWVAAADEKTFSADKHGLGEPRGGGPLSLLIPVDPAEILQIDPQADANRDGKLDGPERKAFMEAQRLVLEKELLAAHPELDANRDGALGPDEMRGARAAMEEFVTSKLLAAHPEADADRDGKLSREEMKAFQMNRAAASSGSPAAHVGWILANFQKLDTDGNGQLTVAELQQFQETMNPKSQSLKPHKDKGAGEAKKNRDSKKARKAEPQQ